MTLSFGQMSLPTQELLPQTNGAHASTLSHTIRHSSGPMLTGWPMNLESAVVSQE
jgi:hypothetical protein